MKVKFTEREFLAFSVAVELVTLTRKRGGMATVPRERPGEDEQDILEAATDGFLRWLRLQLEKGREFPPVTPIRRRRRGKVEGQPR
jgi:hypothetical protein